jgi:tRNA (Thr-GGU) A37 N-methylase
MPQTFSIQAIGRISCGRTEPDDDNWDAFPATIRLDQAAFGPDALQGLESFSHVEVLYIFDRVGDEEINTSARHP